MFGLAVHSLMFGPFCCCFDVRGSEDGARVLGARWPAACRLLFALLKALMILIKCDGCGLPGGQTLSLPCVRSASLPHTCLMFTERQHSARSRAKFHLILKTTL